MLRRKSAKKRAGRRPESPKPLSPMAIQMTRLQRLVVVLAFAVLLACLTKYPTKGGDGQLDLNVTPGDFAREAIQAEFRFETEDLQATREARDAAAAKVPKRYAVDNEHVQARLRAVQDRIDALRETREDVDLAIRGVLEHSTSDQDYDALVRKAVTSVASKLKERTEFQDVSEAALVVWLLPTPTSTPKPQFEPLAEGQTAPAARPALKELLEPEVSPIEFAYAPILEQVVKDSVEFVLTFGVLSAESVKAAREGDPSTIVILRDLDRPVGDLTLSQELPLNDVPQPEQARELLRSRIVEELQKAPPVNRAAAIDMADLASAALQIAETEMTDTLVFAEVPTAREVENARSAVEPRMKKIEPFEPIQRRGERWTQQSISDVKTYYDELYGGQKPAFNMLATVAAHAIFVSLALIYLLRAVPLYTIEGSARGRDLYVVLLILCAALLVGRVVSYFDPSGFAVPVTAVAILLAILLNVRLACVVSLVAVALLSIQYNYDWNVFVVGCTMAFAGALSIFVVRRRGDMAGAAGKATIAGLLAVIAVTLATDSLFSERALHRLALIALNGGACMFIVPGLLSPLERLFGITTDIQLLEYSDLNNEVLGQLAIEVPGTYAHSLMLGQLAEAAAEAIGANGLLARVCAYYHDIGKLQRPEYFSENQTGENIHDDLPPRLSARAIRAHVAAGAQMARDFHLPKPIVDGILEHHGTGLISFFYQQAREQQKHGDVDEADFRYPGPKPQRPETAILMICDAVESGVRSMKNPNQERVREFVDKIIAARSTDRQFDECRLTLKELDTIADVVTRRVVTGLHTRVAYPDSVTQKKVDNVVRMPGVQE